MKSTPVSLNYCMYPVCTCTCKPTCQILFCSTLFIVISLVCFTIELKQFDLQIQFVLQLFKNIKFLLFFREDVKRESFLQRSWQCVLWGRLLGMHGNRLPTIFSNFKNSTILHLQFVHDRCLAYCFIKPGVDFTKS